MDKTCLSLGVGVSGFGRISFAAQAKAVADEFVNELDWEGTTWIPEKDATIRRFLDEAPRFRVIHLACHGGVQDRVFDNLTASVLQLADGNLSAKQVIESFGSCLSADLVFLNACRSAGFRMRLGSEIGGFWQAFLSTGVPSLIATLFFVDPDQAQRIATDFYRRWQSGDLTKAEALQQVQLQMAREGVDFRHWASHILIGDHR